MQGHPAVWFKDYGTAYLCSDKFQGKILLFFFFKADHQYKKSTEEKENDLVKMKIQQLINSSFLFSFQLLTSVFVANRRFVESYPSMPYVSKTRQRESIPLTCVLVFMCVFVCVY